MRLALFLCGMLGAPALAQTKQDNVLIVIADDLGVDWLQIYGASAAAPSTPQLDALAAQGIVFRNAWSSPLCSPTRAALQTGRYGFRTGVGSLVDAGYALPLAELTLPEVVDQGTGGAVAHALFGKWHLGNDAVGGTLAPNLAGWGHFAGTAVAVGVAGADESYFHYTKVEDGVTTAVDGYAPSDLVDDALEWIAAEELLGTPWLAVASFQLVHTPFHAPAAELHGVDLSAAGSPQEDPVPYFRAMIEAFDTELGRLLAGVDLERTTVLFLSDNGTTPEVVLPPRDPEHGKGTVYQGGVHVPMIIAGAAVDAPGTTCDALVHAVDLFSTAAELLGVDLEATLPPELELDSTSLTPYLTDPSQPSLRATLFAEIFEPNGPVQGPLAPAVIGTFCQEDLGFSGPGSVLLTLCGDPLVQLGRGDLLLTGAPAFAPAVLAVGAVAAPTPIAGGTLVPSPPAFLLPAVTDGTGSALYPGLHGPDPVPVTLYVQMAVLDFSQPQGAAISNALRVAFLPWNTKAMRDERFKLIADVHGGFTRFFDLWNDPLELQNLLTAGPLSFEESFHHEALRAELEALIGGGP